jgi:hypothetical protein
MTQLLGRAMDFVSPEVIDKLFVCGSPDDCIVAIERYLKARVEHFYCSNICLIENDERKPYVYAEKGVLYFREEK